MAVLVKIISDYAAWIYAACAVAAVFLLRIAILARRERRQAAFTLERETAINRTHSAMRWAIVVLALMGLTYGVSTYLSKAVEPIIAQADPTPTPVFLIDTPTPTAAPVTPTVAETPSATPTPAYGLLLSRHPPSCRRRRRHPAGRWWWRPAARTDAP